MSADRWTILITGGSGLIGTALTRSLLSEGHEVRHLSRSSHSTGAVRIFQWDPDRRNMDDDALIGVDHIVHLAGAPIADRRWTKARIDELVRSRAGTAQLLLDRTKKLGLRPKSFISAAGIGYYGATTTDRILSEEDPPGGDTIAHISKEWEAAADRWKEICRVVKLRTPVVLSAKGGALSKLMTPVKFGVGSALGSGDQWMPWVHIRDLVRIYRSAIANGSMEGAYNAGPTTETTNDEMMRTLARLLRKPYFMPNVPAFVMHLLLGELATILLEGSRASDGRLKAAGFKFEFEGLEIALTDLLRRDQ